MVARKTGGAGNEYAGTGDDDSVIDGPSINPADIGGSATAGSDSGDSGGTGGDDFVRDASGNIRRNKDGSPRRKRGRKAGGSNGANPRKEKGDLKGAVDTLSRTMMMLHLGLAQASRTPEMALDKEEADLLSNATVNLLSEFDIRPNPKVEATFGLIIAAGSVYGPRFYLINKRRADEKEQKSAGGNVVAMGQYPGSFNH